MKKVQNISLASSPVIIDDDAYQTLKKYLEDLAVKFKDDDLTELQKDIEVRILEILTEQGWNKNNSISCQQIKNCIDQIGDIDDPESDETKKAYDDTSNTKTLFRDPKNGQVFGVCQGLGEYFGVDPVWIRLIFVILTLINGFGFGVYLIAAVIIPEAKTEFDRSKMKGKSTDINQVAKSLSEDLNKKIGEAKISDKLNLFFEKLSSFSLILIRLATGFILGVAQFLTLCGAIAITCGVLPFIWLDSYQKELNFFPFTLNLNEKLGFTVFVITVSFLLVLIFMLLVNLRRKKSITRGLGVAFAICIGLFIAQLPYHAMWLEKLNSRADKIIQSIGFHDKKLSFEVTGDTVNIALNLPISYNLSVSEDDKLHVNYSLLNYRTSDVFRYENNTLRAKTLPNNQSYKKLDCKLCPDINGEANISIPKKVTRINILETDAAELIDGQQRSITLSDYDALHKLIQNYNSFYIIQDPAPEIFRRNP